jgi:hypothetical protein
MTDGRLIGPALSKAIEFLGEDSARLLTQDLAYLGVNLNDPQIGVDEISKSLFHVFGDQAASLIFEMFIHELAKMEAMPNVKIDQP